MDSYSVNFRIKKRWVRSALIVLVTAIIVAPITAYASHRFTDVPDSNTFHADIAWLADAGVTFGCNPPGNTRYCPSDEVTRGQMAAFLRRLAENQVVDAGALEGQSSDAYRSIVASDIDGTLLGTSVAAETEINSVSITAPQAGILVVSGTVFINNETGGTALFGLRPAVNGTEVAGAGGNATFKSFAAAELSQMSYTVSFAVAGGTHSVVQTASALDTISGAPVAGDFFFNANNLTVEWHPEGSISLATSGSESGGLTE